MTGNTVKLEKLLAIAQKRNDIQSRFISYKLELNKVENIIQIEMIKEYNFTFYTDNGSFKVTTVNVPLPISSVVRNK